MTFIVAFCQADLSVSISVFDESHAMEMDGERYRGLICMKWLSRYIILDKLKFCRSISYAAVAAPADQTSRRKLALFQRPALELFGMIQARPIAHDLFKRDSRYHILAWLEALEETRLKQK
ncbi:unnamed protein product [Lactuca saligna]|uniref:Uncharacterized protein n=1 Tax=Lactuca saligna TaxID=75948 RepID=A0AA36ERM8_LACSI|nr:unnamed protein product [Lactuca saligna]